MEGKQKLDGGVVDDQVYMVIQVRNALKMILDVCNSDAGTENGLACIDMVGDTMKRQIGYLNTVIEDFKKKFDNLEQYEPIKVD